MIKKIICINLLLITSVFSKLEIDPSVDSVMTAIMNQHYILARDCLLDIININPSNIDALYMLLNISAIELLDYESYTIHGDTYLKSADSVLKIIESKIKTTQGDENIKYLFYKANIYGFIGLVQAKQEDWLKGIRNARISVKLLKDVINRDSSLFEASLGIGMYNYYVGQNLRWLPFMHNRMKDGIADIKKVARTSSVFSYGAKHNLLWILIDRKKYAEADSIVAYVLNQYPRNTIFLGIKARIALLTKDYNNAITYGKQLVKLSLARNPINWCELVSGYQIIVAGYDRQEKYRECLEIIDKVFDLKIPELSKKITYVKKHLNLLNKVKNKITSKL